MGSRPSKPAAPAAENVIRIPVTVLRQAELRRAQAAVVDEPAPRRATAEPTLLRDASPMERWDVSASDCRIL